MKKNSNEKFTIITLAMVIIVLVAILIFGRIILPVGFATVLATISIFLEKIGIDKETALTGGVIFVTGCIFYISFVYDKGIKAKGITKQIGILIRNIVLILIGSVVVAWLLPRIWKVFLDGSEYIYNIYFYHFMFSDTLSTLLMFLTVLIFIPYVFYRFYRWFKKE